MYVMMEYARDFGIPLKGSRVVIQGFGNVGGIWRGCCMRRPAPRSSPYPTFPAVW